MGMHATRKSPGSAQRFAAALRVVSPPNVHSAVQTTQVTTQGENMKRVPSVGIIVLCLLVMLAAVYGQSVTGQIAGTVADAAGAVVPGAVVTLTHEVSQRVLTF